MIGVIIDGADMSQAGLHTVRQHCVTLGFIPDKKLNSAHFVNDQGSIWKYLGDVDDLKMNEIIILFLLLVDLNLYHVMTKLISNWSRNSITLF